MAWTTLLNALFLPGKPILGSTGAALRDNLASVAAGDPGAPRVAHRAITPLYLGGSNGAGSGYAFTLTGTQNISMIDGQITWNAAVADQIVFQPSTDGGATWGAQQVMFGGSTSGTDRRFTLNVLTGAWRVHPSISGTFTIPSGCNAIRIKPDAGAGGSTTLAVMAWAAGGIID